MECKVSYVIAIDGPEGKPTYWKGGSVCSEYGEDAAIFKSESSAEATIELLKRTNGLHASAKAVDLGMVL
jgi:hypothetical protein